MDKTKLTQMLRIVGIVVFIVIGGIAIYSLSIKPQIDTLNNYVELLGDKFLAMVPEGSGKELLANMYQDFAEKVRNREVEPKQVERVAAGILNLSNSRKKITPRQAEALLNITSASPEIDSAVIALSVPRSSPVPPAEEWNVLGERLKSVYEFNEKIRQHQITMPSPEEHPVSPPQPQPQPPYSMHFRIDEGLTVIIDSKMKMVFTGEAQREIQQELKKLESQKILLWQNDYASKMEAEQKQMAAELAKMQRELEELQNLPEMQTIKTEVVVRTLQSLDSLGIPVPVNVDSILKDVQKSIKKVEVKVEKK
jgi:hypothetical protein